VCCQLTSLLDQLRGSAAWLSEDTRLEFWKKCQSLLIEHNVSSLTAANFLQVAPLTTPSFTCKQTAPAPGGTDDFSEMRWSRSDLSENAERFAQIDLDLSDFEKEKQPLASGLSGSFYYLIGH